MKKVAILISGGGSNMVKLVERMADRPGWVEPCLVISDMPHAAGIHRAEALGLKTRVISRPQYRSHREGFEAKIQAELVEAQTDLICLAGFMYVLSPDFVDQWAGRILNIHPSLLPKYRGLKTHARVLEGGDTVHGCTVHEVTAALDDGPILGQAKVQVLPGDTADTLADRVLAMEHQLYPRVLERFAQGITDPIYLP
ncbi:phosphoribosylglycinamide formyltransferase [Actibacterium sp. 188UL27-1]|uniref:phosphoribosylglycinamide formyltransferase n=1 Tax=Actibacterium sp. 188UL27-1 TaxID=2786961 RepID=UPI00195806EC|nr:phosphoribosylglycinamide formyltransferase [Actibacterium sp. 188UL27-1]MBM7067341.1 phosphoribosylglycinamide formyltransferase [Actibacterium sp. 188UL27-1]